jgi:hypothetical protein
VDLQSLPRKADLRRSPCATRQDHLWKLPHGTGVRDEARGWYTRLRGGSAPVACWFTG